VKSPAADEAGEGFTMTYAADERVDAYIDALPDWQQAICRQVRDLVHATDPGGIRNHQAEPAAVLRAPDQHLRAARST
jgi:hypothetical protein